MNGKDELTSHELKRRELWIRIAEAYTSASNSTSRHGAVRWADTVLEGFDKTFPKPVDEDA